MRGEKIIEVRKREYEERCSEEWEFWSRECRVPKLRVRRKMSVSDVKAREQTLKRGEDE